MKGMTRLSLTVGVLAAVITILVSDLHLYRVTSALSGQKVWLSFSRQPSEEDFLDAVIYRDPLIHEPYETTQAWRKARNEVTRLYIKKDASTAILIMPFESVIDPGAFGEVWLTQPSTRTEYPILAVGLVYAIGSFVVFTSTMICTLALLRGIWYFLLRRVSELAGAIKGKNDSS